MTIAEGFVYLTVARQARLLAHACQRQAREWTRDDWRIEDMAEAERHKRRARDYVRRAGERHDPALPDRSAP